MSRANHITAGIFGGIRDSFKIPARRLGSRRVKDYKRYFSLLFSGECYLLIFLYRKMTDLFFCFRFHHQ